MTLTELRYIVTLAQEQHFGRAAERCHVSQPTLSVGVKKLEDELGVLIFERSKSAVRLTPVGEGIVAQAQKVLEQAQGILAPHVFTDAETDGYWTYKGARIETEDLGWVYAAEKRGTMDKAPPPWWFSPSKKTAPASSELDAVIERLNNLKLSKKDAK